MSASASTSGELEQKLRWVICPKCRCLLPENPEYDVYQCGGCGTKLRAKKRESVDVNSESSTREIDAAHLGDGSEAEATSSSSGAFRSDVNVGKGPKENGDCVRDQLQPFSLSDEELESEQDICKLSLRRNRVSKKGGSTLNKTTCHEFEEINGGTLVSEGSKEGFIRDFDGNDNGEKLALVGAEEELTSRSDGECADDYKSAAVGATPEVEITGDDFEAEDLRDENLLVKEAEENLNSGPEGEEQGTCGPNNDQSALLVAKSEVDIPESTSTAKTSCTEDLVAEKESILVTPDKVEGIPSNSPASSDELQKQSQKSSIHGFEHVRLVHTPNNHSTEISGNLGAFYESPTARSGTLSSYNSKNEHLPVQHSGRKGKGPAYSMMDGDHGTQHRSYLSNGKQKDIRENQNKVLGTARYGHPHRMRTNSEEFHYRMAPPFHRSGSQSRYESRGPSTNLIQNELYRGSRLLPSNSREDSYHEKMKLLRMVQNLQDQLSRETNQSHGLHEGRFPRGLDYARCNGRCSHEADWRQRHQFSKIPYSDKATSRARHIDHSCTHCYPKQLHFLADSPRRPHFGHEELHRSYLDRDRFSSAYPSSPQWLSPARLPLYGLERNSDDQKHRAHKMRRHLRDKHHSDKQSFRPVAGGAPFVTCRNCLNLLQLPADLPLSQRGRCQLKCGKCSEVLEFYRRNRSLVSYSSSNLNEQRKVISSSNVTSASGANYCHYSPTESISISYPDDYRLSVSKSYSSEGNPISLTQLHSLRGRECLKPGAS